MRSCFQELRAGAAGSDGAWGSLLWLSGLGSKGHGVKLEGGACSAAQHSAGGRLAARASCSHPSQPKPKQLRRG